MHQEVLYPSLVPKEYEQPDSLSPAQPRDLDVLVVGNGYPHKDLEWALDFVQAAFPTKSVDAVGHRRSIHGKRSNADIGTLYRRAKVVLYPSHYEGFGLPIMEALAHGAQVIVRSTDLTAELANRLGGRPWRTFSNTEELIAALKDDAPVPPLAAAAHGWEAAGRQLHDFICSISTRFDRSRWAARESQVRQHV